MGNIMPKVDIARLARERAEYLDRARKAEEEVANLRAVLKSLELPTEDEPTDAELEREVDWIRAYDPLDLRKAYRLGRAHGYSKGRLDERANMFVEVSVGHKEVCDG
jgi:hypothetical protein